MTTINKQYSIGVDVGGTKMNAVLFDGENVIASYLLATPKDNLEHFMIMLKALIEPLQDKANKDKIVIKGIGVGVPGSLDYRENRIIKTGNLPLLDGLKLPANLTGRLGMEEIKIDNDASCFLRAEARLGAGRKINNIFGLTIGTGIGGAWWLNGQIYYGSHGGSGEPGWVVVDYKEGIRLEEAYHKLAQNNPASMAEEAYRGDVLAEKSYQEFGYFLGISLANIVNLIDPELIIIGGGVAESSDLFLSKTKKIMREYIRLPEAKKIKIVKGRLGANAGAIGAALLVS
ncbi:MAG: ROK family protein [bacterium]|nr:ROK family protein [bacterium]